jgi:RNA polymerase sigma-B factor
MRAVARAGQARFRRYRRAGDVAAREAFVTRYLPLARGLARRYRPGPDELEDLVQVASLALVKAVDRFAPGRGVSFASVAAPTIVGELKHHFRDRASSMRVPRGLQELALRVDRVAQALTQELGRSPTVAELARHGGVTIEQVWRRSRP